MKKTIYLDYAATTPMDPVVFTAMEQYFTDNFYNPSASYLAAKDVKKSLDEARSTVARQLGAKSSEIIFTAGATEANNMAIQGIMKQFPEGEALISSIEHDSIRTPAWLYNCHEIPVTKQGIVEPLALEKFISNETVLVSIGMVNNEIGSLQPMKDLAAVIAKVRTQRRNDGIDTPIYFHTDAAQAGSYFDLHVSRLGVDMLSLNGGKIYGPKQSGILFVKSDVKLLPLIAGGGQEGGMRAGTENVPAIIGLSKALELAQTNRVKENKRLNILRDNFIKRLSEDIPGLRINGSSKSFAPHIVSASLPGMDNERLMMELDEAGVQCATGSACHASSGELSHVLTAIGLEPDMARSTLRFSLGRHTTAEDITAAAKKLYQIVGPNR